MSTTVNTGPAPIAGLLDNRAFGVLARTVVCFPFLGSGLAKILDFNGAQAEMAMFGLNPTAGFAVAVILTDLIGSALLIHGRHAWLGAGMLAVFTALTIPIVHRFWAIEGMMGVVAFHTAVEHIGMIGGLMLGAIQAHLASGRARAPG